MREESSFVMSLDLETFPYFQQARMYSEFFARADKVKAHSDISSGKSKKTKSVGEDLIFKTTPKIVL